jgi:lactate dehydrogenase-like 2-hydroxyacid dehydrogenase
VPRVVVTRRIFPALIAELQREFDVRANQDDIGWNASELATALGDADGALLTAGDRVDEALLAQCPRLKVVANIAVGINNLDLAACTRHGVLATNTPDVLTEATADTIFALLLASARRVVELAAFVSRGEWQRGITGAQYGVNVHAKTLGILGMGRIGRAIARRATGFSMPVIYHNRTRLPADLEGGARHVALPDLLCESDHLVLVVPYSAEVHHLIDAAALAQMKPTAVLVNIARGGVVDDRALVAALRNGRIAAAGLDVFENEPALHPGLLELENVVLTPHIASSTRATRTAMAQLAMTNLRAALAGQVPPSLVNPEVLQNRRR